ncbi:DUF4957 domain-containing protein [Flavobacterium sp. ANB]|uniref:DUF5123 domain-containing protein n=1 Tax=unclassified Flavobacterium TaxID=196869 RepID=UPI0012B92784|nr:MULTISPECIES: DUF5123 domain-containing protein [unclassified Flavobacterium]MBF4518913.1 DUF4957 domain-containing protein [Flavobacterium sp. ANB]MTD71374.1 DUF4957 domain-containing protein [Flavobacterium sp. LC2016-13]
MMKTKYILKGLIATLVLAFAISSCESYNEGLLDSVGNTREFSPLGLTAKIKNQTTVELNWTLKQQEVADHFVVEFSADDPEFKTIYKTMNVTQQQLPIQVALEGETVYSIRVKSVGTTGLADSSWSVITATTLSEQIFFPVLETDIEGASATLRWTPNSNVTQITTAPGNITHTITAAEKTAGVATVTGLTGDTFYTATLLNGTKTRGTATFTTGVDVSTGTVVNPEDNLNVIITQAAPGAKLYLMPGDYNAYVGDIILTKPVTIRGVKRYNKPLVNVTFTAAAGASAISLIDLDLDGTGITNSALLTITGASSIYNDILISGCKVHDFARALVSANASATKVKSLVVDNSIVTNVNTNVGADFIDFRNTYVTDIILKNSTFNNCSTARDFVRADAVAPANGFSGTGLNTNVLIDKCTLYKVSSTAAPKRILYVRFSANTSAVRNTLIAETTAIYTNQAGTTAPIFTQNYYYNAPSFMDTTIALNKVDAAGITANPQFTNAATGDFTIGNQTLKDNAIGDPRWIK